MTDSIVFIDLAAQQRRLRPAIDAAIAAVLDHGQYLMGPEVAQLESELAEWAGVPHVVTCASGTDALVLALMALGVGPGDRVLVPAFTFAATAEAVALVGATPVFVDVRPDTFNLDPDAIAPTLAALEASGGDPPVGVIPVDLFGQPAEYERIRAEVAAIGAWVIADAAQSFGGTVSGARVGSLGDVTCTSFFPAKPLGGYGDGGAVFVSDQQLDAVLRSLRIHGEGVDKYDNVRIGMTGRLDTLQAAVLLQKLTVFAEELEARRRVAARYSAGLAGSVEVPFVLDGMGSAWAQYTVMLDGRDAVASALRERGIPTALYYPRPVSAQPAYQHYPAPGGVPSSDRSAARVLSLPMHPYLDQSTQDRIIDAVREVCPA